MENIIYVRMRHRVLVNPNQAVRLKDVAQIISDDQVQAGLSQLKIHQVRPEDKNRIVIDVMKVIDAISRKYPSHEVQAVGQPQSIIEVQIERRAVKLPLFILVWLLLFIGAALTIMNFHEDVSMREVQQRLFTIMTGKVSEKPLIFQIPYSFGLGLGMILFFNHVFKKRINEEPSPLEVEMFNYQQSLDQYVVMNENKESINRLDDH